MNLDPAKLIPWAIAAGILFAAYQWAPNVPPKRAASTHGGRPSLHAIGGSICSSSARFFALPLSPLPQPHHPPFSIRE